MRLYSSGRLALPPILLVLLTLLLRIQALKQPTSYCKCICFQNSTIIPLNSPSASSATTASTSLPSFTSTSASASSTQSIKRDEPFHTLTCADCNRAFCLDLDLPICKDAKEEDVFATCFQRDSLKDMSVIICFLAVTGGLLLWALVGDFVRRIFGWPVREQKLEVGGGGSRRIGVSSGIFGGRHTPGQSVDVDETEMDGFANGSNEDGAGLLDGQAGKGKGRPKSYSITRQGGLNS